MVAGRLQEKNGFYYIVLSYTDSAGKRRQPWIGTGLPVKGNKKRAEKMLAETRKDFTIPKGQVSELSPDMAFSDYMRYWLKMMRTAVTETTYSSYCNGVQREHNKKLNNGLPILHKVPPKRDYGRYFCIMAEKGGTSHGGLTEKLSPFFHAKKQEVNAYGR